MARTSKVRSYWAFIKAVRAEHGLSLKEARATYKSVSERLGRPAKGVDVARHPRITKQEAERAAAVEAPPKTPPQKEKPFASLRDYLDWYDDYEDILEYEEADGTVDY